MLPHQVDKILDSEKWLADAAAAAAGFQLPIAGAQWSSPVRWFAIVGPRVRYVRSIGVELTSISMLTASFYKKMLQSFFIGFIGSNGNQIRTRPMDELLQLSVV